MSARRTGTGRDVLAANLPAAIADRPTTIAPALRRLATGKT
ncbi:MAG TPA: hypothetical protein VKB75_16685 [Jatrophihabitans sp.]|nr:hypothetical protein [Jatrophihabitans sp.]